MVSCQLTANPISTLIHMSACGKILRSNVSYLGTQNEFRASDVTNQQISILICYKRLKKGRYIVT